MCTKSKLDEINLNINRICEEKGGRVLTEYTCSSDKIEFMCKNGHKWKTRYLTIKSGCWCPKCFERPTREKDFVKAVKDKGGTVEGDYIGMNKNIKVKCDKEHIFEIKPRNLLYKDLWCGSCGLGRKRAEYKYKTCRRRPYKKGPRCKHLMKFGKRKGEQCTRKSVKDGLCKYHMKFKK